MVKENRAILEAIQEILKNFDDQIAEELADGLLPLRDI